MRDYTLCQKCRERNSPYATLSSKYANYRCENDLSDRASRLAKAIRSARREADLSQGELAEAAGVTRSTVSNWERGKHEPTEGNLEDIAEALGMSVGALKALAEERAPAPVKGVGGRVRERAAMDYGALVPPRIPPAAYQLIYDYTQRMEEVGVPEHAIEEARRLMSGTTFNTLNKRTVVPRDEKGWILDVKASWSFISRVLREQGFDL